MSVTSRWLMRVSAAALTAALTSWAAESYAASPSNAEFPLLHRVQPGQTLGMIARRFNVSVDGLCHANQIARKKPIHPGQKLIVPAVPDKDGKLAQDLKRRGFLDDERRKQLMKELERQHAEAEAKKQAEQKKIAEAEAKKQAEAKKLADAKKRAEEKKQAEAKKLADAKKQAEEKKQADAKRLAEAKQAEQRKIAEAKRAEQKKIADAKRANAKKPSRAADAKASSRRARGYVRIHSLMGSWEGYTLDAKGNVTAEAKAGFRRVLRSWRNGAAADIDPRLIRMVADVSEHFKGKRLYVVSGFRPKTPGQHTAHSRHNSGEAVDFRVEGVKNEALRDYVRRFSSAGVGYYPNSGFIHLDARPQQTYWVDHSGPGEAPRYAHQGHTKRTDAKAGTQAKATPPASEAAKSEPSKDAEPQDEDAKPRGEEAKAAASESERSKG
ncbi:MAG: DUF882 domain-containing protein [Polyangiaceae bacterium]|nr:DUF882 domain-containing protein [Polyangiaceae bacterium]MCW5789295.1 DUF882 domain-containing protein [Polyangiaceae bacterium]